MSARAAGGAWHGVYACWARRGGSELHPELPPGRPCHAADVRSTRDQGMVWPGPCRTTAARVSEASEPASRWGLIGLWPQALSRRRWLVGLGGARARAAVRADLQPDLARCVDVARVRVCFLYWRFGPRNVLRCESRFPFPQRPRRRLTPPYWLPTALPTPSRRRARARAARATRSGAHLSRAGTGRKSHCTALLGAHSGCVAVGAGIRPTAALLVRCWRTMARSGLNSGRAQAS